MTYFVIFPMAGPLFRPLLRLSSRHISTYPVSRPRLRRTFRTIGIVSGGSAVLALALSRSPPIHHDAEISSPHPDDLADLSLGSLLRFYTVYTMCSIPALVDNSPRLLELASLPVIRWFAVPFVRITFFDHFVGGDTAEQALPVLRKLRAANKGAIFAYSVEADNAKATSSSSDAVNATISDVGPPPHKRAIEETIHCLDVAADFEDEGAGTAPLKKMKTGRRTWIAIKLSALLPDADALFKLSAHIIHTRPQRGVPFPGCPHESDLDVLYRSPSIPPGKGPEHALTPQDMASLRELYADLARICTRAKERGIKVLVDAEYSWYQPAIDAMTLALTSEFNKLPPPSSRKNTKPDSDSELSSFQPLVYGTYQAYLRRTPAHLTLALSDAKKHHYALGVKLVRGAYHPYEVAAHRARKASGGSVSLCLSDEELPPVWSEKEETDACYDACVGLVVGAVKEDVERDRKKEGEGVGVGVVFGTHNWKSCDEVLNAIVRNGMGRGEKDKVVLGEEVTGRVAIAQLFGMSDDLTNRMVRRTVSDVPLMLKWVPYGALAEVMPYLSRRAIENKSVLGEGIAARERRRAGREIRRRVAGFLGIWGV